MSFVNTSRAVYVYINGIGVSDYLISGELSDDSVYTNSVITTTGTITLGGSSSVLDFDRSLYPIGSTVSIWAQLDNGEVALHPKGTLYVINSTINIEERTISLEVGCSLAFIADKEDSYAAAVSLLFDQMLGSETKSSFVVDNRDLSTLSNLLEVEGSIIYQDQYGNIQKVPAFGRDGLGSKISPSKLTSFDKYTSIAIESIADTAIEPNVASVLVEGTVEVPGGEEPVEPLITSVTERLIDKPIFYITRWSTRDGYAWIDNVQEGANLTSETNPNCGTPYEATPTSSGIGYNFQARCSPALGQWPVPETVTNGSYKSYNGPGNQVDREESWEYCSAATWANTIITNVINGMIEQINAETEEANALLQKANQHYDSRDDEPYYRELIYNCDSFGTCVLGETVINPRYVFHDCNAKTFYEKASSLVSIIESYCEKTRYFGIESDSVYGVSTFSQTLNYFGEAGEITRTVTREYKNRSSFEDNNTYTIYLTGGENVGTSFVINSRTPFGEEAVSMYSQKSMPTGPINNPKSYDLYIVSELVKTYEYGKTTTIEREEFTDYIDATNNYKRTNYSSSGSTNAEEADKLISTINVNGEEYCNDSSETEEITASVQILDLSITGSTAWFGNAQPYEKKVSMPVEFAPILPIYDPSTSSCTPVTDESVIMNRYKRIMTNYASVIASKIAGDNRGFRITEKLRAEIFEYYPFYPVTISAESLERAFTARVAASNWVFDSQNAVCSFDCLISGDIEPIAFPEPGVKTAYIKTETTVTVDSTNLLLSETANSIQITGLPADGNLLLNGSAVSENDIITTADLDAGNLTFVPSISGTAVADITFTQLDASDELIRSDYHIYPPLTSLFIDPDSYGADGGEFTLGVSNNGLDSDAGNLDTGLSAGGPPYLEAGDFDTGLTVVIPPPSLPPGAPSGNASVDPEVEYGIHVKDQSHNQITVETLPTVTGDVQPIYGLFINFDIEPRISVRLTYTLLEGLGWNFAYISNPMSVALDAGTFLSPTPGSYDFGTFDSPIEPVKSNYVS